MTKQQKLTTISNAFNDIKDAIENKGVVTTGNISTYASAIDNIVTVDNETATVAPSTTQQILTPSSDKTGFSSVTVNAVTSAIDNNITAGNIKDGVTILGVTGDVEELNGQTKTVTPTTSNQTVTPDSNYNALTSVTVNAVTSAIDNNITAGNIKKDVTILGVTGSYEGSGGVGIAREVSAQGVYQMPTSSFSFSLPSDVTDVGSNALQYAFYDCTGLTSIDLSSLTSISGYKALNYAFYGCTGLTGALDLSNLTSVSAQNAFQATFQNCTGLTSVDLSGLTTVYGGGSACSSTFQGCTGLTSADLSNLTSILFTNGCSSLFQSCTSLTSMSFPKLTDISASNALNNAFKASGITTLSFPALTSTSFGSFTDQFSWMLYNVTGCTVHFPSNLQSVIGSWTDVTTGFKGTNTTVLFDLPATT